MSTAKIIEFKKKPEDIDDEDSIYSLRCGACGSAAQKICITKAYGIWVECAECQNETSLKDAEQSLIDCVAHIESTK